MGKKAKSTTALAKRDYYVVLFAAKSPHVLAAASFFVKINKSAAWITNLEAIIVKCIEKFNVCRVHIAVVYKSGSNGGKLLEVTQDHIEFGLVSLDETQLFIQLKS